MITLNPKNPKPVKTEPKAPELLEIQITNKNNGEVFMKEIVQQKHFSTGSVGYFLGGKMTNPESGERYQVSCNIALIGSKPEEKS
jgi:hypothetical protein